MRYIKGLDTVRAFAVLLVIFYHWWPQYPLFSLAGVIQHVVIPTGEFGVNLFFVLSGFLITSILLKAKAEKHNNLHVLKNFIIRRSLRIFPVYYLLIGILVLTGYPFAQGHLKYFLTYTANILVVKEGNWNNFSHTWSLSVEEQFYLIWPWLILFVRDKYEKYVFYSCILFAVLSLVFSIGVLHMSKYTAFTPNCFDAFGLGGLYAWCRLSPDRLKAFKKKFKVALIFALVVYITWELCPYFGVFPKYSFFDRTIDSIISAGLIDLVIDNKNKWVKTYILENKYLNEIGKISYGLYLFHYPFPALFAKHMLKIPTLNVFLNRYSYLYLPVMLALLIAIAFLSFELFEKQITSLKGRFKYVEGGKIRHAQ